MPNPPRRTRLTREVYYATPIALADDRGALHDAKNCAALRRGLVVPITRASAQALLASGRWHLCKRCRGMK